MKTRSKIFMALAVVFAISITACLDANKAETQHNHNKDDHGHSHADGSDHSHEAEEVKQEEFTISKDSIEVEEKTHVHDNGEVHHAH